MPKAWIYYIAVFIPFVVSVVIAHTGFVEWLWYNGHEDAYYFWSALRVNPMFVDFVGGWPLPVFICTVLIYWSMEADADTMSKQFLLLPIVYVPFSIVGNALSRFTIDTSTLYAYPLVLLPAGYLYILPWVCFIWIFTKLHLVTE